MNVDVPNEVAAPIGDGEMTRWACTEQAPSVALVPAAAAVPIAKDVNAHQSPLVVATTLTMLLLAVASFVTAVVVSPLVFLPAAITLASLAVLVTLATIPGIWAGFRSESHSFGVDTRSRP